MSTYYNDIKVMYTYTQIKKKTEAKVVEKQKLS